MVERTKVPPDGGYGWVITLAMALSNLVLIPLMQSFGLIFKDTFNQMGLSATQGSLIINMNAAFGMLTGLINGVLLKMFGYRKVAFAGAALITVGIVLTSFATTFTHFILSYGLITSLGFGLNMSAYGLAMNSYFKKNRGKAMGYTMTITGLGPILMPQLITLLSRFYTVQGTTLILGSISAHCFISAALLQPVKWHMKEQVIDEEKLEPIQETNEEKEEEEKQNGLPEMKIIRSDSVVSRRRKNSMMGSTLSIDHDIETAAIYGMDSAFSGSVLSLHSNAAMQRQASIVSQSFKKMSNLNLANSINKLNKTTDSVYNPEMTEPKDKKPLWKRVFLNIVTFFDLDLLKDPIYINIMLGMSLAIFAELNFSVLTAFILADFGLTTNQSATFLSVLGIADIIFRFFAPYIGDYLNKPPRLMYQVTLLLLMLTRFSLLISTNYIILLGCALGLGIAKGIRTVYMGLVIPAYVPLDKLPSASGIQMMVNGLCIMIGGPIIGMIRDATGSYTLCIVVMNCITFTTVLMWTLEAIILRLKKRKEAPVELKEQEDVLLTKK